MTGNPWIPLLLAGGIVALVLTTRKTIRFAGDNAEVGDEVMIPAGSRIFISEADAERVPKQANAAFIILSVRSAMADTLTGPMLAVGLTGEGLTRLPEPHVIATVYRAAVAEVAKGRTALT